MHDVAQLGVVPVAEEDLARQFGPFAEDGDVPSVARELSGERYAQAVREMTELIYDQWTGPGGPSPLRGFFLSGPPGTGKTTLIRRVAYELGRRSRKEGRGEVRLLPVDGGHIARSRYGDSEERIRLIFRHAQEVEGDRRSLILLDDVESILMKRGSEHAREWHFSQDSVFFHVVDELDSRRAVVCLTSNRPDLVDEAILDRFLRYELPAPDLEILLEALSSWTIQYGFDEALERESRDRLAQAVRAGGQPSFRDIERIVLQAHVQRRLGTGSLGKVWT